MSRSAEEQKAILKQFREWLTQTIEEIDAMDSAEADDVAVKKADDTGLDQLTEFVFGPAAWVEEVTRFDETIQLNGGEPAGAPSITGEPEGSAATPHDEPAAPLPDVGLRQLIEAFTAMRHDLKLQTKSARGLENALQPAVAGLEKAMGRFQAVEGCEQEAAKLAAKPFVETLIGLDEAFLRGARAFESMHQRIARTSPERTRETVDEPQPRLPRWRQWFVRDEHRQTRQRGAESPARDHAVDIAHLMEGYTLIQTRIERALREHEIYRIESTGRRVNPSEMTVVELVDSPDAEPETVVEEVRPGYKWRDKVIRFAEVRAVRGT